MRIPVNPTTNNRFHAFPLRGDTRAEPTYASINVHSGCRTAGRIVRLHTRLVWVIIDVHHHRRPVLANWILALELFAKANHAHDAHVRRAFPD